MLVPKLVTTLRDYDRAQFLADLGAGLIVGVVVPMAALAAILGVVSYHMSEWRTVRAEMKAPRSDAALHQPLPPGVQLFAMSVPVFFGAVARVRDRGHGRVRHARAAGRRRYPPSASRAIAASSSA